MAATVIASAKASAESIGATGVTVTHGFTLQNNDVLVAVLGRSENTGSEWASASGGTWTQIANATATTGDDRAIGAVRRVVTNAAGEPATYTFTRTGAVDTRATAVILLQLRGVDTTTPEDATPTTTLNTNDFTPPNATITTVTQDALLIVGHMAAGLDTTLTGKTAGVPAGYTLVDSIDYTAGTGPEIFSEVAKLEPAGAPGLKTPGSWTGTPDDATSEWATVAIAMRPGDTSQTITAGAPVSTTTAPVAAVVALVALLAGAPVLALTAPTATLDAAGGAQTLAAGAPVLTVSAPATMVSAEHTLGPASATVTLSAPSVTLAPAAAVVCGAPSLTISAPIATVDVSGGDQTLTAGAPVVTWTAPSATVSQGGGGGAVISPAVHMWWFRD